jgi:hypothetical protein
MFCGGWVAMDAGSLLTAQAPRKGTTFDGCRRPDMTAPLYQTV